MRISDWSSDVCSSDLLVLRRGHVVGKVVRAAWAIESCNYAARDIIDMDAAEHLPRRHHPMRVARAHPIERRAAAAVDPGHSEHARAKHQPRRIRSEEHTSELQSLMRNSHASFCVIKIRKT